MEVVIGFTKNNENERGLKKMKKVIRVPMIVMMFLLLFLNSSTVNATGSTGQEIPEGYTPIYSIEDLDAIRYNTRGKYILMNDIDMSEATKEGGEYDQGNGWDCIDSFSGVLDGNGYRIIGMQIFGEIIATDGLIGLFENIEDGAEIKNLGVTDCNINVSISSEESYYVRVGGIAAYVKGASFDNCYTSGTITVKGDNNIYFIGGMIGEVYGGWYTSETIWIRNCYNACDIDSLEAVGNWTGGIIGYVNNSQYCYMRRCYNAGSVQGGCYVTGTEISTTGAICGNDIGSYQDCKYLKTSATQGVGGVADDENCVALTETRMKNSTSYANYDFDTIWEIDPYCSYPYPQFINNRQIKVSSVKINKQPEKLEYFQGDALDFSDATLDVTYEDEITTTIPITNDMLSGYDMNIIGTQMVNIEYGGKVVSLEIEVKEIPVTSVTIPKSISLYRSKTYQLEATVLPQNASDKTLEWESADENIVTVDENGLLKAKAKGTTTITVTTANNLVAECKVTVLVASVSVNLNQQQVELKEGESFQLVATIVPLESTDTVSWESSNVDVADVYEGTIIAKSQGTAVITAYTESGVKNSCTVTVKLPFGDVGDIIMDAETGDKYRILTVDDKEGTVEYAGVGDKNKKDITIPAFVTIDNAVYKVTAIADNAFKNNNTVTKVIIGDNVITIGKNAFSGCKNLKTITIGKNVTTIASKAFYNCKNLTKVTIPSKVTKIDTYAFKNCKKMSSVTIGKAVKTIGKEAFRGCSKLKSINIKSKKLKTVGKNAFKGIKSNAKIKVPSSKLKPYKKLLKNKGQGKKVKITK